MQWYEVVIALLAAFGGGASVIRVVKMVMDWRRGVVQRTSAPTDRLVAYLEGEVTNLKTRVSTLEDLRDADTTYISLLVFTMASAGVPVPMRSGVT